MGDGPLHGKLQTHVYNHNYRPSSVSEAPSEIHAWNAVNSALRKAPPPKN